MLSWSQSTQPSHAFRLSLCQTLLQGAGHRSRIAASLPSFNSASDGCGGHASVSALFGYHSAETKVAAVSPGLGSELVRGCGLAEEDICHLCPSSPLCPLASSHLWWMEMQSLSSRSSNSPDFCLPLCTRNTARQDVLMVLFRVDSCLSSRVDFDSGCNSLLHRSTT